MGQSTGEVTHPQLGFGWISLIHFKLYGNVPIRIFIANQIKIKDKETHNTIRTQN